jgi:hypothetical protein
MDLHSEQLDVLAEMNAFNIEGRYPETYSEPLPKEEALRYMQRAEEVLEENKFTVPKDHVPIPGFRLETARAEISRRTAS